VRVQCVYSLCIPRAGDLDSITRVRTNCVTLPGARAPHARWERSVCLWDSVLQFGISTVRADFDTKQCMYVAIVCVESLIVMSYV
jgi:hypothetical protein